MRCVIMLMVSIRYRIKRHLLPVTNTPSDQALGECGRLVVHWLVRTENFNQCSITFCTVYKHNNYDFVSISVFVVVILVVKYTVSDEHVGLQKPTVGWCRIDSLPPSLRSKIQTDYTVVYRCYLRVHLKRMLCNHMYVQPYTGCNRRNGPDFGRVFLMLNYTEKPQNTYIQS